MKCIERKYFQSYIEDAQVFWQYLSCVEKIAYHQVQNRVIKLEEVFCNDINICLFETEKSVQIDRNSFPRFEQYFEINIVENIDRPDDYIHDLIDNGKIVGLNTSFYDIPNFTMYQKKEHLNSQHYTMVVGYDLHDYWITDVPRNLCSDKMRDDNIMLINKEFLNTQLTKQCKVLTIQERRDACHVILDIENLIVNIVSEFRECNSKISMGEVWTGKNAYERFICLIKDKDARIPSMFLFKGPHYATTISGRHNLLKRNIIKRYNYNEKIGRIINQLEVCERKWDGLANKIYKEVISNGFYRPDVRVISEIYIEETKTIEMLSTLLNN